MIYLIIVSTIWAFSFGLIKGNLSGLDPFFVSSTRLFLSFLIFLPFLKFKNNFKIKTINKLILIGAIQFGIMYLSYIYSYQYLKAYEVALFTIFTPIHIAIINAIINRKIKLYTIVSIVLSVIAVAIVKYNNVTSANFFLGFILVQIANFCFAIGQVFYVKFIKKHPKINQKNIFAFLYLGAFIITFIPTLLTCNIDIVNTISSKQILTLLYLGIISSGLAFFLWNYGASKTKITTLAVMNNTKVPVAIIISFIFFKEKTDLLKLSIAIILMSVAIIVSQKKA